MLDEYSLFFEAENICIMINIVNFFQILRILENMKKWTSFVLVDIKLNFYPVSLKPAIVSPIYK